jgi:hypothetical protein
MDIHIFDGQFSEGKEYLLQYIQLASQIPFEDKLIAFEQLRNRIQLNATFDIIVNDFRISGGISAANYNPIDNLHAGDLLYLCAQLVEKLPDNDVLISVINQQFTEMHTGLCPSGRTHRLFQVIMAFSEFL